jgi:succinoglycan biosynthesis protein ExoO
MIGRSAPAGVIYFISRQRISGKTSGSSAYVLSIVGYLKSKGYSVHYLSPSPATFGRWPFIRLLPDMDVFDSIRIRGSIRLGRFLLLLDPAVMWRGAVALLDSLVARTGLSKRRFGRPAPYSVAVPLSARDGEFLRRNVPPSAGVLLLDYAFLTPCIEHCKRGDTISIVLMHDLFSARAAQFDKLGRSDSVVTISEDEEMSLLSAADLVVAIQEDEAAIVKDRLPSQNVVVAPIPVQAAPHAFPGDSDTLLFVGSNTAPNTDALQWFVGEIWPRIRKQRPSARLLVAGSVSWVFSQRAPGVEYLGVVPDLDPLYRRAGVVVSPLRVGSGLKIKLVEALGWGKAIVGTSVSLQGIGALVDDAMAIADTPGAFAAETLRLMDDRDLRAAYGEQALQVAAAHFREEACYRGILRFLTERAGPLESHGVAEIPRREGALTR